MKNLCDCGGSKAKTTCARWCSSHTERKTVRELITEAVATLQQAEGFEPSTQFMDVYRRDGVVVGFRVRPGYLVRGEVTVNPEGNWVFHDGEVARV
jgi:hypothetical protein